MKSLVIRTISLIVLGFSAGQASANYIPPVFPGTGPYQRVYSDSAYSYMSASIYLPGNSQITIAGATSSNPNGNGDTPYVYAGGWGLNGAGAVDAGLQYSPTYNDWSLFASGEGVGRQDYGSQATRLAANQTISLTFAVVQAGPNVDLVVSVTGVMVNTSTVVTESLTLVNVAGWSVGGQNTLKRMTSIAQSGGDHFTDGSVLNGVGWSNVMLGQNAGNAQLWSGGGSQSYNSSVVSVNYISPSSEIDSINLNPVPEPQSWAMLAIGQVFGLGFWWRHKRRTSATA